MYSQLPINIAQKNTMTTMKLHLYDNRTDIALTWYPFSPGGPCGPCSPCHTPYSKQTRRVTYGKQQTNKQQTNNKQTNKQAAGMPVASGVCVTIVSTCPTIAPFGPGKPCLPGSPFLPWHRERERKRDSDYLMHLDSSD